MSTTLTKLFSRCIKKPDGCWVIGYPESKQRYWSVGFRGRGDHAHRVVWTLIHGEIPSGMEVCHTCDNTRCINPGHLYLGTHAQNMADRDQKGRCGTLGECSPLHKLTSSAVLEISRLCQEQIDRQLIANTYGVSQVTVSRIAKRSTWKHLLCS